MTLRQYRERALVSREVAGKELDCSESKISRIENGDVRVNRRDLHALLDLYGIAQPDIREELLELAAQGGKRGGWWMQYTTDVAGSFRRFMELESVATSIRRVSVTAVPGILQTPDYTRAVVTAIAPQYTESEIDRQLRMRADRQARLRQPEPPHNWVILDEAVLHRVVGGPRVMAGQLRRLRAVADSPAMRIQLLPFDLGAHQGMPGSFALLRFHAPDPDVGYSEGFGGEVLIDNETELAGCTRAFTGLAELALAPEATKNRLEQMINEYATRTGNE